MKTTQWVFIPNLRMPKRTQAIMDENIKRFRKGEILFSENKTCDQLFLIQSGKVSIHIKRSGKKLELEQIGPGQICGEQALIQPGSKMPFDAEAASEVRAMVVPVEAYKNILEKANPGIRIVLKSLFEVSKQHRQFIRKVKMDEDPIPLPQNQIAKFFCMLNMIAKQVGQPNDKNEITLSWGTLKIFVNRMFLDLHSKMKFVLEILKKLEHVDLKFEKNEEGEEELSLVVIKNLSVIEEFAEFYQYNYFKGGRAETIYVDSMAMKTARLLIHCTRDLEADRRGFVTANYGSLSATAKQLFKLELKPLHFDNLEKKGLFVKRQTLESGEALLSLDKVEFNRVYSFWKIIEQIDRLNEKGFVDFAQPAEETLGSSAVTGGCSTCGSEILPDANFCVNCGAKVAKVA